ncbi:MAG: response regulator [Candidatus Scalindua sp.]|nr:response regulator [Candidatus Scalindua sp.]
MSKVLVVDDDVMSCELLDKFFTMKGDDLHMAYEDIQASEIAMSVKPDIILLGITMLGENGLAVLKRFRESEHKVAILVLSEVKNVEIARNALKMGADDYLTKPVNFAILEQKIASFLIERGK